MSKRNKAAILAGILTVSTLIGGIFVWRAAKESRQLRQTYASAVDLIGAEDYAEALVLLETIADEDFADTAQWISLCKAVSDLQTGSYANAYRKVEDLSFSSLSDEQTAQIDAVIAEIEAEYDDYCARLAQEKVDSYAEKVRTGVPFVGMSESDIANTSLGAPSSTVRHNVAMIDGQTYAANLYDFYAGSTRIFSARCVQGRVTQVWDMRNRLTDDSSDTEGDSTDSSDDGASRQESAEEDAENDPFDAASYSHPDDFYFDYYDDFYDYEDAEDYWEAHH